MAYCGPRGIPHSHFLGGPLVWTASDRDKALAWQRRENSRCPSCGTREDEWDRDEDAYHAVMLRCPGCEQRQRVEKAITDADGLGVHVQLWTRAHHAAVDAENAAKAEQQQDGGGDVDPDPDAGG